MTFIRQSLLLAGRSLRAVPRVPDRILDVTLQPIVFTALFVFVFRNAIHVPGMTFVNFLVPGILGQGIAFALIGCGSATAQDMREGVIDRFRSMPVNRLSIVTGQVLGQFAEQVLGLVIYMTVGLICGWSPKFDFVGALEFFGLMLLLLFAFTWVGVYVGLLVRSAEAVQGVGFTIVFPLSFLSGAFVPINQMPAVPRAIGYWNPLSAVVAAARHLSQGTVTHGSWLLEHAVLAVVIWAVVLLVIFIPLALRRFNSTLAA